MFNKFNKFFQFENVLISSNVLKLLNLLNLLNFYPNHKHHLTKHKLLFLLHAQIAQHISKFNPSYFSGA